MSFKTPKHCLIVLLTLGFFIINKNAFCQIDSLMIAPFKEKKSLTYGINNRRTYLLNQSSTIYGAYMGIQYGKRMKHVITINSSVFWAGNDLHQVRMNYAGLAEEYILLSVKRFELILYTHLGLGIATHKKMTFSQQYVTNRELISPIELGIHSTFTIYDWLKLNCGTGYRFVLINEDNQFNNIYYKVGIGIDLKKFKEFRDSR